MKSNKLKLSFNIVLVFALALSIALPCVTLYTTTDTAYAATSVSTSTADWTTQYTGSYYNGINANATGTSLRSQVAELITDTHKTYTTYSGLANAFKVADADPNKSGNIIWFYSGTSMSFSSFGGSVGDTNREHVWPKDGGKAFSAESGPGSDAHHLRPTETNLNSIRGDKSFDEVPQTSSNIVSQNGSKSYGNLCYSSGSFFYPGVGYRGATARILFYMQTRWGGANNLTFVDSAGSCKTIGKISTLMKWHLQEPPTDEEIRRNEAVFKLQGNRNPFIDHPEYAAQIYCNDGQSYNNALKQVVATYGNYNEERPDLESLALTPKTLSLEVGASQTLSVQAVPTNANSSVTWSSSNNSIATVSNGKVTAVDGGTATITATSTANANIKATVTVTVTLPKPPKKATEIELVGTPSTTQYQAGQTFNPQGLTVKVAYDDGSVDSFTSANDLNQFEWLDAATGSRLLTETTTTIKCKYGSLEQTGAFTVTVTAPPEQISGFIESVTAIDKVSKLSDKLAAIKAALAEYEKLSSDEKANPSAQGAYQTLLGAINDYNAVVDKYNSTMEAATKTGAYAICGGTLAAIALIVVLQRKFN